MSLRQKGTYAPPQDEARGIKTSKKHKNMNNSYLDI
jgi:hypothetical protein